MTQLNDALRAALTRGPAALDDLHGARPESRRDRAATLLTINALHSGDVAALGRAARWQHHPVVAGLKHALEAEWLDELQAAIGPAPRPSARLTPAQECVAQLRALAARMRLPEVYRWVSRDASREELVRFLSLEGGPDGGFDDLVALCQVGLVGEPKMTLARNYWDELGDGSPADVHGALHEQLVEAMGITAIAEDDLPVEALERAALPGVLATNHWLQPELLGALGLVELCAGPRCRTVVQGLTRVGAPAAALPFYEVHAEVDPRHGVEWLAEAITPLAQEHPDWAPRMVRGAAWKAHVDAGFFAAAHRLLVPAGESTAAA